MTRTLIARWETKRKKNWLELYKDEMGFTYKGNGCGGNLGDVNKEVALQRIEEIVKESRKFKVNMNRVM